MTVFVRFSGVKTLRYDDRIKRQFERITAFLIGNIVHITVIHQFSDTVVLHFAVIAAVVGYSGCGSVKPSGFPLAGYGYGVLGCHRFALRYSG